jgi:hypothetical protein
MSNESSVVSNMYNTFEPRNDKTLRPAWIQTILRIRTV